MYLFFMGTLLAQIRNMLYNRNIQRRFLMRVNSVELKISAVRRSQYPTDEKPEFLLVGRSNVGKSSFINTLINRKNYARTSSNPGKTQTINFYLINNDFYLVDAPGEDDIMMYEFLKHYKIPVTIVATKSDKVGISKHQMQRNTILSGLELVVGDDFIVFSNVTKSGKSEVYEKIERII